MMMMMIVVVGFYNLWFIYCDYFLPICVLSGTTRSRICVVMRRDDDDGENILNASCMDGGS